MFIRSASFLIQHWNRRFVTLRMRPWAWMKTGILTWVGIQFYAEWQTITNCFIFLTVFPKFIVFFQVFPGIFLIFPLWYMKLEGRMLAWAWKMFHLTNIDRNYFDKWAKTGPVRHNGMGPRKSIQKGFLEYNL